MSQSTTGVQEKSTRDQLQLEKDRLQLERDRFQFDKDNADRDYRLKQQESAQKRREVSLPLLIGLIAAVLTLGGNVLVTYVNNNVAQKLAQEKNDFDKKQQLQKAQSDLLLALIKTNNPKATYENVSFFTQTGLMDDPDKRIQSWFKGKLPAQTPSLPVAPGISPPIVHSSSITLKIEVQDKNDNAVQGARISCNSKGRFETKSDENGIAWCNVPSSLTSARVEVQVDGFKFWSKEIDVTPDDLVIAKLQRSVGE